MLHQAIRQLVRDVMWGQLDYLIVDLPPGTGDVQLTLTQSLPLTGAVMVTTPQDVALGDVLKGGEMFRQLDVPLLGVIENMSYYICPHCGKPENIFGQGGGQRLSEQLATTLLTRVPLDPAVRISGDGGSPIVLSAPNSPSSQALHQAMEAVLIKIKTLPVRPRPPHFVADPDLPIIP
jgi:ATP-binding protein involved in chromosome partitioning